MADTALAALIDAIGQAATAGVEPWGQRVYSDFATSGADYPYLVYFWLAGGEENAVRAQDAFIRMGLKAVAEDQATAFACAVRLSALFNDRGTQDVTSGALNGGADWQITTSTQGLIIHIVEYVVGASPLYHEGHQFAFRMQAA